MSTRQEVPALEVQDLFVSYGELKVLQGVSLCVEKGERRCIIGPNGAGKTTFFNVLAGVVRPTAGLIRLMDQEVSSLLARERAHIGVARTFQRTHLFPELSVVQNLELSAAGLLPRRYSMFRSAGNFADTGDEMRAYLDRFGLDSVSEKRVGELGYGEQRQIEIIMALIQKPKLLLLDEPTAGLAAADGNIVTDLLNECPDDMTIIMIEHDMDIVFQFASRISVLNSGTIVADGNVEEIRENAMVQSIYLGVQGNEARDQ